MHNMALLVTAGEYVLITTCSVRVIRLKPLFLILCLSNGLRYPVTALVKLLKL